MKTSTFVLPFPLLNVFAFAKEDSPKPNRWRGIVLDESTTADVIKVFGEPKKKDPKSRFFFTQSKWIRKKHRDSRWNKFHYENISDFEDVIFIFDEAGKVKVIQLEPSNKNKIPPENLSKAYGIEITPIFGALDEYFSPQNFKREQGKAYARTYPDLYRLGGGDDTAFVMAQVVNRSLGSILSQGLRVPTEAGSLPGTVAMIQLVSRTLENKDGIDTLK